MNFPSPRARRCLRLYSAIAAKSTVFLVALGPLVLAGCNRNDAARKQEFFESGSAYYQKGKYSEAAIQFRNAVQIDARFGEARAALAATYDRLRDAERAMNEYVRAADLLPDRVDLQLAAGNRLLAAGRFDDALARADAVLARRLEVVDAHLLRGNALRGRKDFDSALGSMEEALRLEPGRSATYTQIGALEMVRGREMEAERAFARALKLAPESVDAHLALASFYWATNRSSSAADQLRAALRLNPRHVGANRAMAMFSIANGRAAEAEQYLIQVAEYGPRPNSVFALADYYLATGRAGDAVARLEPLATDDGKVPGAPQRLARAHLVAGNRQRAEVLVDQLLERNPKDVEALLLRGELLLKRGRRDEAFDHVRLAVETAPAFVPAQFALAQMYAARGDTAGAEKAFREVLRLNPRAAAAQAELARLQIRTGNLDASLQSAEAAATIAPRDLDARLSLVRSLIAKKNLARAEAEISQLRIQSPNVADVHTQSGVLAILKNDVPRARVSFERALSLDPRSVDALAGLIGIDVRAANYDAAKARIDALLRDGAPTPELLLLAARTYASTKDMAVAAAHLRRAIEIDPNVLPAYALLGSLYLVRAEARSGSEGVRDTGIAAIQPCIRADDDGCDPADAGKTGAGSKALRGSGRARQPSERRGEQPRLDLRRGGRKP